MTKEILGLTNVASPDGDNCVMLSQTENLLNGPCDSKFLFCTHDVLIHWALLGWHSQDDHGVYYRILCSGWGVSGALREPRHTDFGDGGYIHYLSVDVMVWGMTQLKRFFD